MMRPCQTYRPGWDGEGGGGDLQKETVVGDPKNPLKIKGYEMIQIQECLLCNRGDLSSSRSTQGGGL